MKRLLALAALWLLATPPLHAQRPLPPRLVVEKAEKPVTLQKAEIGLTLTGPLAAVEQRLTFFNPNGRILEGELLLPLPEGATLTGYAIDVNGELVDAIPIEKERARVIYETEVRKGVDPGLAEKAEGNVFKLRVYPIPAGGTRTIRVRFDLEPRTRGAERIVTLPLRWGVAPEQTRLLVEGGAAHFGSLALDGPLVREKQPLDDDLTVRADAPSAPVVHVARFTPASAQRAESFFLIENHEAAPPAPAPALGHLGFTILWDASLSRRTADTKKERELLRLLLARLDNATVRVRVLRDTLEPEKTFPIENGDGSVLLAYLDSIPFDGGTDLSALKNLPKADGFYLLFSDGLSTLGKVEAGVASAPLWAVTSGDRAAYPQLRAFSERSGGALIDLSQTSISAALWQVGHPTFGLLRILEIGDDRGAKEIHFRREGSLVVGKLVGTPAQLELHYGYPGQEPLIKRNVIVEEPASPKENPVLARWWAAQEAERLSADEETNHDALIRLGQDYGIVTEGTSLLVLETLEQHIEHRIRPARTRAALYDAYLSHEKTEAQAQKQKDAAQLEKIVKEWNETLDWQNKIFTYPKNFRYKEAEKRKISVRDRAQPAAPPQRTPASSAGGAAPRPVELRRVVAAESEAAKKDGDDAGRGAQASVAIKPWSPDVPYVKAMKAAGAEQAYSVYLSERKTWGETPAFYLDCAETLFQLGRKDEGRRVLLGLADLSAGDPALLRILARRLLALGDTKVALALFEKILTLRAEEPQSLRDLALAHEARGEWEKALEKLDALVRGRWQRGGSDFAGIEVIALIEANGILARVGRTKLSHPLDARLVRPLSLDLRIVLTWDTDLTDMDLHVIEPSGEECSYNHNRTTIGGHLSHDCTRGYGPEEYFLKKAMPGSYKINAQFYGSQSQKALGATTVQATVITNFGRPSEKRSYLTLRLTEAKETVTIGDALIR